MKKKARALVPGTMWSWPAGPGSLEEDSVIDVLVAVYPSTSRYAYTNEVDVVLLRTYASTGLFAVLTTTCRNSGDIHGHGRWLRLSP